MSLNSGTPVLAAPLLSAKQMWSSDSEASSCLTTLMEADNSVTVVVKQDVKPGEHMAFELWNKRTAEKAHTFTGHLSSTIVAPSSGRNDYVIVYRFDNAQNLAAWHGSTEKKQAAKECAALLLEPAAHRLVTGWYAVHTVMPTEQDEQRLADTHPGGSDFNLIEEVAAYSCIIGAFLMVPGNSLAIDAAPYINVAAFAFLFLCGALGFYSACGGDGGKFVPVCNMMGPFLLFLGSIAFLPTVGMYTAGTWGYRLGAFSYFCGTVVSLHSIAQIPNFTHNSSGRLVWTGLVSFLLGELCFLIGGGLQQWITQGGAAEAQDVAAHLYIIGSVMFLTGAVSFKLS